MPARDTKDLHKQPHWALGCMAEAKTIIVIDTTAREKARKARVNICCDI